MAMEHARLALLSFVDRKLHALHKLEEQIIGEGGAEKDVTLAIDKLLQQEAKQEVVEKEAATLRSEIMTKRKLLSGASWNTEKAMIAESTVRFHETQMCTHELYIHQAAQEQQHGISIDDRAEGISQQRDSLKSLQKDVDLLHKVMCRVREFSLKLEGKHVIGAGETNTVWAATVQRLEEESLASVIGSTREVLFQMHQHFEEPVQEDDHVVHVGAGWQTSTATANDEAETVQPAEDEMEETEATDCRVGGKLKADTVTSLNQNTKRPSTVMRSTKSRLSSMVTRVTATKQSMAHSVKQGVSRRSKDKSKKVRDMGVKLTRPHIASDGIPTCPQTEETDQETMNPANETETDELEPKPAEEEEKFRPASSDVFDEVSLSDGEEQEGEEATDSSEVFDEGNCDGKDNEAPTRVAGLPIAPAILSLDLTQTPGQGQGQGQGKTQGPTRSRRRRMSTYDISSTKERRKVLASTTNFDRPSDSTTSCPKKKSGTAASLQHKNRPYRRPEANQRRSRVRRLSLGLYVPSTNTLAGSKGEEKCERDEASCSGDNSVTGKENTGGPRKQQPTPKKQLKRSQRLSLGVVPNQRTLPSTPLSKAENRKSLYERGTVSSTSKRRHSLGGSSRSSRSRSGSATMRF